MKVMVITPGRMPPDEVQTRQKYLGTMVSPGTEVHVVPLKQGPVAIDSTADLALLVPGILERVREAKEKNYNAVMVHGFVDPGVEAARTIVDIPIVGPGEATYHLACMLADKFAVVTVLDQIIPNFLRAAKLVGVAGQITSMRATNIPVLELKKRSNELIERFTNLARKAVEEEDAQLIIPGCLGFLPNMGKEAKGKIERELGVPILDPQGIGLKVAEMLVNLKLSHSKKAFPGS